jgi:alkylation response protein AidB-like acyl-CoA dehydrogenase
MNFEVTCTEEQQRFRSEVRAWLEANVPPGITGKPLSDEESLQRYRTLRAFGRQLGARGWLYPRAPEQYGGGGLDVDHAIISLTSDEAWGSPEGFLELQQRNGIIAVHPGGTADIQLVSMARRIGIGRAAREAAGTV